MKKKDIQELHNKSKKELEELMKKVQTELVRLRTDFGAGKLKNVNQIKLKRRDLARIKTVMKELELVTPAPVGRKK